MTEHSIRQHRTSTLDDLGWTAASGTFLKKISGDLKWRQAALAEAAGVSRSTLLAIFSGERTPKEETLEAICRILNITVQEVLDVSRAPQSKLDDSGKPLAGDVKIGGEDYSLVKRYAVKASAGPGRFPLSESISGGVAFSRSWLLRRGIAADLAGLVVVAGDSMTPTIPDGATVLVQFVPSFEKDGVYVFSRGGEVCVKRVSALQHGDDGRPRSLVITSDNPEYPPEMVQDEAMNDLRFAGVVKTVLTDL